jgi:hypothetical protein
VPKAEKYAESMRKCANCYFCSKSSIFLVCSRNFFGVWEKKLSMQYKVLPPFGKSFVDQEKKFEYAVQTFAA